MLLDDRMMHGELRLPKVANRSSISSHSRRNQQLLKDKQYKRKSIKCRRPGPMKTHCEVAFRFPGGIAPLSHSTGTFNGQIRTRELENRKKSLKVKKSPTQPDSIPKLRNEQ